MRTSRGLSPPAKVSSGSHPDHFHPCLEVKFHFLVKEPVMSWEQFAMAWGPAIPLALVMLRAFSHLVYIVIPAGFTALERLHIEAEKRAELRHQEHMDAMQTIVCNHPPGGHNGKR
jgi:hypothetical protein